MHLLVVRHVLLLYENGYDLLLSLIRDYDLDGSKYFTLRVFVGLEVVDKKVVLKFLFLILV